MSCKHKRLDPECKVCRSKVKSFSSETEFQLYKIDNACARLLNLIEKSRVSGKVYDMIAGVVDEITGSCGAIKREHIYEDQYSGSLWPISCRGGVRST